MALDRQQQNKSNWFDFPFQSRIFQNFDANLFLSFAYHKDAIKKKKLNTKIKDKIKEYYKNCVEYKDLKTCGW